MESEIVEGTNFKEELEETHRSSNDFHNVLAPLKEILQARKTPRLECFSGLGANTNDEFHHLPPLW